jgi:hypothetical protein
MKKCKNEKIPGGEKVKGKVILLSSVVFLLVFAVAPAMALPTPGISCTHFTAVQMLTGTSSGPNYVNYVTDDNVRVVRDLLGHGIIKLWISPNSSPSTPNLQGTTSAVIDLNINLNTGEGWATWQMTWTFTGGTFQGTILGKWVGPPGNQPLTAYAITWSFGVLKGTGVFEGKTAIYQGAKPVGQPWSVTGTIVAA